MSRKSEARRSVCAANNTLGGAKATKAFRNSEGRRFIAWCFANGHPITSIGEMTAELASAYLKAVVIAPASAGSTSSSASAQKPRRANSVATQQNKLSVLRRCMSALGKDPDALGITSKALGLGTRSRNGTKLPIPDDLFWAAVHKAEALDMPGMALALKLERFLGLRCLEAMMSTRVLAEYYQEARERQHGPETPEMRISDGTKGGRPRVIRAVERFSEQAMQAIHDAVVYAAGHGNYLITSDTPGLKSARSLYHRMARQVGLVGAYAPHSLRYSYTVDKIKEMAAAGFSRKETLEATAALLGHGASRARYITQVYGRSVVHTLPKTPRKKSSLLKLAADLEKLAGPPDGAQVERGE